MHFFSHIMLLLRFGQIMQLPAQTNNVVTMCSFPARLCEPGLLLVEIKEEIRFSSELHPSSCAFPQLSGQILERAIEEGKGPLSTLQMGLFF